MAARQGDSGWSPIVPWLLVGLVAVLAVATGAALLAARDADRHLRAVRRDVARATDVRSADLLTALRNERTYASAYLLGLEQALDLEDDSFEESTAGTDAALATLRDGGDPAVYGSAIGEMDARLGGLRASVTGAEGPRSLDQADAVDALVTEYETLVGAVLDAEAAAALAIDDPATRAGALLLDLSRRQPARAAEVVRVTMMAGLEPRPTPEDISAVAASVAALRGGEEDVRRLAVGGYRVLADEWLPGDAVEGLATAAERELMGDDPVSIVSIAQSADVPAIAAGYASFSDRVEAAVDERGEELTGDAEAERLVAGLAARAGLGAVATGILLAVMLERRRSIATG